MSNKRLGKGKIRISRQKCYYTNRLFYEVKSGETLSKLAKTPFGNANRYMEIFNLICQAFLLSKFLQLDDNAFITH
jgi:hypothetical protein